MKPLGQVAYEAYLTWAASTVRVPYEELPRNIRDGLEHGIEAAIREWLDRRFRMPQPVEEHGRPV